MLDSRLLVRPLRTTGGVAFVLALSGCIDAGIGTCTPTGPSVDFRIHYPSRRVVDPDARPTVEGLLRVGEVHSLTVTTLDGEFCGTSPAVTWNLTDPAVARIAGGEDALLTATSPGHTDVTATVRFGGRVSEARLSWCQPPGGGTPASPFPASECTWIPMSGIRVVP